MRLFDSHAHLDDDRFASDRDNVIRNLITNHVDKITCVGASIESSTHSVALAQQYDYIYAAVGVHPHNAYSWNTDSSASIEQLLKHPKVVALGEIGLDYHYDFSPRDAQKKCLNDQIRIAKEVNLPIIYHIREAFGDFLPMVRSGEAPGNAVMHCYGGSKESAKECLDAGMLISFTGVITFKNAHKIKDVVRYVPLERMMIETDCPYMAPVPYRGKRNEPKYVLEVARAIAEIKEIDLDLVCESTYHNACNFFNIDRMDGDG